MDIIREMEKRPFEYREVLGIPKKVNFGLELELDKVDPNEVYKLVRKEMGSRWSIKDDKSLTKGESAEIVSPVLQNTKDTWKELLRLGEILESLNPDYDKCSFQVNFDGSLLPSDKEKVRLLKLFAMYEDIIYRFSQGDSGYRDSLDIYAAPIILALKGMLSVGDGATVGMFSNQKRYGITFKTRDRDLIEYRPANMTNNPLYWQNYINVFYYLTMGAAKPRYDKREVDRYIDSFARIYILEGYERENRDKAIEFAELLLPGKSDKSNFMHQYVKKKP